MVRASAVEFKIVGSHHRPAAFYSDAAISIKYYFTRVTVGSLFRGQKMFVFSARIWDSTYIDI